jgi:hypothetical protein
MMTTQRVTELSAHDQIRQVSARFARGVDRLDGDLMKSAYWPDATDDHGFFVGNAMDFCDLIMASHGHVAATMHCMMNHAIEVDEEAGTGRGEVYNITYVFRHENGLRAVETWWGRYLDAYERRNGEWRIKSRVCVHECSRADEVTRPMAIDASAFRQGSADRGTKTPLGI